MNAFGLHVVYWVSIALIATGVSLGRPAVSMSRTQLTEIYGGEGDCEVPDIVSYCDGTDCVPTTDPNVNFLLTGTTAYEIGVFAATDGFDNVTPNTPWACRYAQACGVDCVNCGPKGDPLEVNSWYDGEGDCHEEP